MEEKVKKSSKKSRKKPAKKQVEVEDINDGKKFLTREEILEMELNLEKNKSRKLIEDKSTMEIRAILQNVELFKKEVEVKQLKLQNLKIEHSRENEESKKFNNRVKVKYDISGAFGIDPDTGEVVES